MRVQSGRNPTAFSAAIATLLLMGLTSSDAHAMSVRMHAHEHAYAAPITRTTDRDYHARYDARAALDRLSAFPKSVDAPASHRRDNPWPSFTGMLWAMIDRNGDDRRDASARFDNGRWLEHCMLGGHHFPHRLRRAFRHGFVLGWLSALEHTKDTPPATVPAPAAFWLLLSALGATTLRSVRRNA